MIINEIVPFRISVSNSVLADLAYRLANTRLPTELPGDGWDTGVPVAYLKQAVDHWANSYDWRTHEAHLNTFPQFTTEIDGQIIHFLHVRSSHAGALPLLLTHGWPGSFVEFLDVIAPLTEPADHGLNPDDAYDVVIPSLPGFGFSTPVATSGWDSARIGRAWAELMHRLGYDRYGVQGGDIGAAVSPDVARAAPANVVGVHVNGSLGMPTHTPDDTEIASLTDLERDRLRRVQQFMNNEFGYIAIQSTRPQTLAAALVDSPAGPARLDPRQISGMDISTRRNARRHRRLRPPPDQRDDLLAHRRRRNRRLYRLRATHSLGRGERTVRSSHRSDHVRPRRRDPPLRRSRKHHHPMDRHHRSRRPLRSPRTTSDSHR